jgi:hypothetical protein
MSSSADQFEFVRLEVAEQLAQHHAFEAILIHMARIRLVVDDQYGFAAAQHSLKRK